MKKRIVSLVTIFALALSVISTSAFVTDAKAVSRAEEIDKIVDGIEKDVKEYHKTHIKGKNGSRTVINNNFKATKKVKKGKSIPSSYVAPYTSIKDQAYLSTCWMFAEESSLESNLLFRKGYQGGETNTDPIDLSEAQGVYTQYNRETQDGTLSGEICSDSDNDVETFSGARSNYGYQEGGWSLDATMVLSANKGAVLENDNPYVSQSQSTIKNDIKTMATIAASTYRKNRFDIKSAEELPEVFGITTESGRKQRVYNPGARDIWKNKLIENGALSSNYYQIFDDKYHHGYGLDASEYYILPNFWFYDANINNKYDTNHVITIVGWDDNYSKYNFMAYYSGQDYDELVGEIVYVEVDSQGQPTVQFDENGHCTYVKTSATEQDGYSPYIVPREDGAWSIKNSYATEENGKKVYDDGIMYMSYMEETLAETISSVVLEDLDQIKNNKKTYDTTLSHSSMEGVPTDTIFDVGDKAAEVYSIDSEKDFELGQIGYWAEDDGTTTRVKVYNELSDASLPESGNLVFDSGYTTDTYHGYHTIALDDKVVLTHGSNASIVITQECNDDSNLAIEIDYKDASTAYYLYNSNDGDTFYYKDNNWYTSKEVDTKAKAKGYTVGNSTVKMFGNSIKNVPKYTVKVDGVETEVYEGDGFTFPTTSVNGYANADYSTLYEAGQTITVTDDITVSSIKNIGFSMEKGASVDLRGNDGLRFCAQATYEDDAFLNSNNVELGTLITPEDIFIGTLKEKLDLETAAEYGPSNVATVVNSGWRLGNVGSFAAGIIHLKEYNWNRSFIARSFMKIKYSNGSQKVLYTELSDTRSLVQVVENLRDEGYPGLTADQIAMLQKYLSED